MEANFVAGNIVFEKELNNNDVPEHFNQVADNQNRIDVKELDNTENAEKTSQQKRVNCPKVTNIIFMFLSIKFVQSRKYNGNKKMLSF